MQCLIPNIWNSLTPQQRAAIVSGNSNSLFTEAEIASGFDFSALDELLGIGSAAGSVCLDASGTVN